MRAARHSTGTCTFLSPLAPREAWQRRHTSTLASSRPEALFSARAPGRLRRAPRAARPTSSMPAADTSNASAPSSAPSDDAADAFDAAAAAAAEPWRPALVHDDVVYNVALGSNMSEEKMRIRGAAGRRRIVPLAPPVPCTVPGYVLAFDLFGIPPAEPAMAGAVRQRVGDEGVLHGVLYKLSRYDYETLAQSEGCSSAVSAYAEHEVTAVPYESAGANPADYPPAGVASIVFALRYPPETPLSSRGIFPSQRYMSMVVGGARKAGLDPAALALLEDLPVARAVPTALKGYYRFSMIGMFSLYTNKWLLKFARTVVKPVILEAFVRQEAAWRGGQALSRAYSLLFFLTMAPLAVLGLLRAAFQRRNVFKIALGRPE